MTAPDPGLTDLIAAALYSAIAKAAPSGSVSVEDMTASVLPVVEQHTNGRMAEENEILRNDVSEAENERKGWSTRALTAEAAIARVRAVEAEYLDPEDTDIESREDVWRFIRDLRAALEGEQQ